jgi:hypothetical protein
MQVSPSRITPVPYGDALVYFSRSNVLHGDVQMMSERPCRSGQSVYTGFILFWIAVTGHWSLCFMAPTAMKIWGSVSWLKCLWDSDGEGDISLAIG